MSATDVRRVWTIIRDRTPRDATQVMTELRERYGIVRTTATITARLRDLRKPEYGQHNVLCYRIGTRHVYQLAPSQRDNAQEAATAS